MIHSLRTVDYDFWLTPLYRIDIRSDPVIMARSHKNVRIATSSAIFFVIPAKAGTQGEGAYIR